MSLLLFIIAVSAYYYLYQDYFTKPIKALDEADSNETYLVDVDSGGENALKRFVLNVFDPANNNYVDSTSGKPNPFLFRSFADRFQTFEDVVQAIKNAGLEKPRFILGIDFTASNEWQGRSTHKGYCLHHCGSAKYLNPYQMVINIMQNTLRDFSDHYFANKNINSSVYKPSKRQYSGIPAYGFGDSLTADHSTFSLKPNGQPCEDFQEVLTYYKMRLNEKSLGGPTSYAPVIYKAIEIVEQTNQYHILLIITDGQFVRKEPTIQAIVAASHYPLSIVVIGVGDGPWATMRRFDDWLPQRQFDNFQFVEYENIMKKANGKNLESLLALHILMEIPDQYKMIHKLEYIGDTSNSTTMHVEAKAKPE